MADAPFGDYDEARAKARRYLPRALFDYIDRGTEGERALAALRQGFDAVRIVPRVLRPVAAPDIGTTLMGRRYASPFIIAPTALAGLVRHDGEVKMGRAAGQAGIPFCAATQSSTSIGDIAAGASGAELWFQLYVWRDRAETWALLDKVAAEGVETLVLTVDTPASPKKVHNLRNGFGIPLRPSWRLGVDLMRHPAWTIGVMGRYLAATGLPAYANYPVGVATSVTSVLSDPRFALDTQLSLRFVGEVRRRWAGKLILKGILHPDDAQAAFAAGCDAVVISSHGGRNHDSAVTPLEVCADIRAAVGPGATLIADSGVRRGSDAAKLLARGADAVMLGRAPLFGLAAGGDAGAARMIALLEEELRAFLVFSGISRLGDLARAEMRA
ncbi:alpha-hydroxy acid oxidase [Falsirhodobacter halotolerans]|uniref:alpha-hydroxy acid oxidase n=1 Tax=Falsirhodobacter halotolerans TaxID=1146892 RepID=UPI001FCFFC88|nr:alpha-hydroxy acid oxidase [Falsirhodobacter halotolerans]MCJ8141019.1 alpha-hydroxy-acid oxidizing protein [Falsirhodobacter halotolerans]